MSCPNGPLKILIDSDEASCGEEKIRTEFMGHCLVNWATCTRPRKWGRLGIKDLEKVGWALRLRWLRCCWDTVERPWKNLFKPRDKAIKELFYASTVITVGNGKLTPSGRRAGSTGCLRKSWLPTFSSRRVSNIVQFIKCSTGSIGLRTLSTLIQRNCWMSSFSCFTCSVRSTYHERGILLPGSGQRRENTQ
jgi:hypothetical protein